MKSPSCFPVFSRLALLAALTLVTRVRATEYFFGNFDTLLHDAGGTPWASPLELQLGTFTGGFVPTAGNTGDWLAHWVSGESGYYSSDGPEWAGSLALVDNLTFAEGAPLFAWVFDTQSGLAGQWGLFSDPAWLVATNSLLDVSTYSFDFGPDSFAVLGQLDFAQGVASTATLSAVPEPATVALAAGLLTLAFAALHRRRVAMAKA